MQQQSAPRVLDAPKRIVFMGVTLAVSFLLIEVGLRTVVAFQMGPRALLYGTSYYRNTPVLPQSTKLVPLDGVADAHRNGDHSAVGSTGLAVETAAGGYAKYFPNESKVDFDENGNRFDVTINEHGFRGKTYTATKAQGTVRVAALGASSTFGYFDRDDETYPHYLEGYLNQVTTGLTFEVLNFGIPHLTSDEIVRLFEAEVLPLEPDVVTFYEGINDSSAMPDETWRTKREQQVEQSLYRRLRRTLGNLGSIRWFYSTIRDRLMIPALLDSVWLGDAVTYDERDLEEHLQGKSERFLGNIKTILEACRKRGIVFIVMTQQARSMGIADVKGITYDDEVERVRAKLQEIGRITHQEKVFLTHKVLMEDLRRWVEREHVPLVDVIGLLNNDRGVLLSWVHLNPRGNRLIAGALASEITRQLNR